MLSFPGMWWFVKETYAELKTDNEEYISSLLKHFNNIYLFFSLDIDVLSTT